MKKLLWRCFILASVLSPFLIVSPVAGFAKAKEHGGKQHGGKEHKGMKHAGKKPGGTPPAGFEKGKKKGWEGEVPPGWDEGKKKGWGEAGMPPGLAKKKTG